MPSCHAACARPPHACRCGKCGRRFRRLGGRPHGRPPHRLRHGCGVPADQPGHPPPSRKPGYRAVAPERGGCCGALAMHYGYPEAAKRMARARIAAMEGADVIVVNSAGCSAHMKTYGELLAGDPAWAARARAVGDRVRDVMEMDLRPTSSGLGRVAMHDACHHVHAQGIATQPRRLLREGGADCVEIPDGTRCCGAAGLYSVTQPELSARATAAEGARDRLHRSTGGRGGEPRVRDADRRRASGTSVRTCGLRTRPSCSRPGRQGLPALLHDEVRVHAAGEVARQVAEQDVLARPAA